jgi:hypothetical protein
MKTLSIVRDITNSSDLDPLQEIVQEILGEVCWQASLSYGDELSLDIGKKIPYPQKAMAGREGGSWILGCRASKWVLESPSQVIASSQLTSEEIKQKIKVVEGTKIANFKIDYPDLILRVEFSTGCELKVFPDLEDLDLSDWELFTPDDMLVEMGPGRVWSYNRADVPMSTTA